MPLLEVAANSLASALAAQAGGADRIELCAALELGGLTPSHAQIALTREQVRLPLFVLIRPRAGDFVYSDADFTVMCRDIEAAVSLGCDGIVTGALARDGGIDVARCRSLLAAAAGLPVTFHRAFDLGPDLPRALEALIALGFQRVLTSGGRLSAPAGADTIRQLVAQAGKRIAIMPGGGLDSRNIAALREATGAREFHASAKRRLGSLQAASDPELADMSAGELRTDGAEVTALVAALRGRPGPA